MYELALIVGVLAVVFVPRNKNANTVLSVMGVIVLSLILWSVAINSAGWIAPRIAAGGSTGRIALILGVPPVLDGVVGVLCVALATKRKSKQLAVVGVTALIMGALLLLLSLFCLVAGARMD